MQEVVYCAIQYRYSYRLISLELRSWSFIHPIGQIQFFTLITVNRFRHHTLIEQGLYTQTRK